MIHTPARGKAPRKRSQAIIESEAANSTAPTAAIGGPTDSAVATIVPITTMYAATGTTSARSARRTPGRIRRARAPITTITMIAATRNETSAGPSVQKPDDVAHVGREERRQPGHELLARQHEQNVAGERKTQCGDEPRLPGGRTGRGVECDRGHDEAHERHRLADVLEPPVCVSPLARTGDPVADGEDARESEREPRLLGP